MYALYVNCTYGDSLAMSRSALLKPLMILQIPMPIYAALYITNSCSAIPTAFNIEVWCLCYATSNELQYKFQSEHTRILWIAL